MKYRNLGNTDLQVSQLSLGTMTFGEQNSEAEAFAQLDVALDAGINFIDTAEMYPVPANANTYGATETIIGNWLKTKRKRDQIILATKVIGHANWLPHIRHGKARLDRKNIETAVDASLRRLQTDVIDLYQVHWPDRKTNFFGQLGYRYEEDENVPILETLQALSDLVANGKVRYLGISNETPWGTLEYLQLSEKLDLPRLVSIQNPYNLLNRTFEVGLAEIAHRESVGLLAYSPLAFGALSGKYLDGSPDNARLTLFPQFSRYTNLQGIAATRAYVELARRHGFSPSQMALAFVNTRPFLYANIIGATTLVQLQENIESINIVLTEQILAEIDAIHETYSNPCP